MAAQSDDTSLDELLALYQTAQDAPAPFAPMGEPDAYPAFGAFDAPAGDPATDQPFPPFGSDGDLSFPAFGETAFPAFGEAPHEGPIHPPADFAAPAQEHGFGEAFPPMDHGAPPFGLDAPAAEHAAPGGFDFSNWDSAVPPVGGDAEHAAFPAFEAAPAAAEPHEELHEFNPDEFSGPVFGAIDEAAPAFPAVEHAAEPEFPAFGAEDHGLTFPPIEDAAPAFPPIEAGHAFPPMEEAGPVFPAMEEAAPAFPAFGAEPHEELQEFNPDEFSGPVFGAIEEPAPAFPPMAHAAQPGFGEEAFPAFGAEEAGMTFPPIEDAAPVFPPMEATPPIAPVFEEPAPVFPAFEEPVPPVAPVIPPVQQMPVAPPEPVAPSAPVAPPVQAAPPTPVVAPPVQQAPQTPPPPVEPPVQQAPPPVAPPVPPTPKLPEVDPEETLRLREVEVQSQPAPQPSVAIANGLEVTIRTPDDRKNVNYQLTQAIGSLNAGLDELQGKLAFLYGDLQRAAVRRAPVEEIQAILQELAQSKSRVAQGSDLHKQALLLRQVADAYLQLLQEL